MSPDPAILAAVAVVINAYLGDPLRPRRGPWHPAVALARAADWLAMRLNLARRSETDRRVRGALVAWLLAGAAVLAGWGIARLSQAAPLVWLIEYLVVMALIEVRQTHDRVARVADGLAEKGLTGGRATLPGMSPRDPALADADEIGRIAVEVTGARLARQAVGPVLFYMILGLPGLLGYRAVLVLADRLARPTAEFTAFGGTARALARIVAWPADWAAALALCVAAAATDQASPRGALATLRALPADARHPPTGALAGALGLALEGPRRYAARIVDRPWIGAGRTRATAADIRHALALYRRAILVILMALAVIAAAGLAG